MRLIPIILIILTAACGEEPKGQWLPKPGYQYTTEEFSISGLSNRGEIKVEPKGDQVSPEQVQAGLDIVWNLMSERYPELMNQTTMNFWWDAWGDQYRLEFMGKESFYCSLASQADGNPTKNCERCNGVYHRTNYIQLQHFACLGDTSFTHELIHFYQDHMDGMTSTDPNGDSDHALPGYWDTDDSLETIAAQQVRDQFCYWQE